MDHQHALNVLGSALESCCFSPMTGYFRDGYCRTIDADRGSHTICAIVTEEFLDYSAARGNDLVTPRPDFGFPGLKPGDSWCVCASRWLEAERAGKAPPVKLRSCHAKALDTVDLEILKRYQLH
ncbi:MAG: DUF2237 family protein [Holosporales bacterium]